MLSAGAQAAEFANVLHYAYAAGANGFLAGRASWWQALKHFPDLAAAREQLEREAVPYMKELRALTATAAKPWSVTGQYVLRSEGEFAANYGPA